MKAIRPIHIIIFILCSLFATPMAGQTFRDTTELDYLQIEAGSYNISSGTQMLPYTGWGLYLNKTKYKLIIDLGAQSEDYNFGSGNPFDVAIDSLAIKISYTMFGSPQVLKEEVLAVHIDESHPEAHLLLADMFTGMYDNYSIDLIFGQFQCPSFFQNDLRIRLVKTDYITCDPPESSPSTRLYDPVQLEGKQHLFSWDINASPEPNSTMAYYNTGHFQLQIMRLGNTNEQYYDNPSVGDYDVKVDWSKALDLEIQSFDRSIVLTLAEGTGYYIWRVRAIGNSASGGITNPKNWGGWSDHGDFVNGTDTSIVSLSPTYLFDFEENEENTNWIYKRSFAEGQQNKTGRGIRIGENMTYANGLQQVVQTQSYQDTRDTIIAQNIYYDYSGREALQSMAVPAVQNHIQYKPGMMYNLDGEVYQAIDFDSTGNFNNPHPVESDTSSFYYYSDNNTSDYYVPNAEGYPFSRNLFYSGTSKLKETGTEGATHRINPDSITHTIRKYYTGVADPELIKVFGKEAPDAQLVSKEITVDQNNVASVKYTDHDGKVLATCLAYNPEMNRSLENIPSYTDQDEVTYSLSQGTKTGDVITDKEVMYLFDTLSVEFTYDFTPKWIEDTCINFCKSCDYLIHYYVYDITRDIMIDEQNEVIQAGNCYPTALATYTATFTMYPGEYEMVREVTVNNTNPVTDDLYIEEHLDALNQMYEDVFALLVDPLDSNDIFAFYNSIDPNVELHFTNPGEIFQDSVLSLPFGDCDTITVPIMVCPTSICYWGTDSLEAVADLVMDILGSGFTDTQTAGANTYDYAPNDFTKLFKNMINEGYNCDTLWDIFQGSVYTYPNVRDACLAEGIDPPSLLNHFLDAAPRRIGAFTTDHTTLLHTEYKVMYLDSAWTHEMNCAAALIDSSQTANSSFSPYNPYIIHVDDYSHYGDSVWNLFYECVNAMDPDAITEDPQALCERRCEERRAGFEDEIRQVFYRDNEGALSVEGDEFGVEQSLWHTEPYYIYNQSTEPMPVGFSFEEVDCFTNALVENCKDYCTLTYQIDNGDTLGLGTPEEIADVARVMVYDFEIAFVDSDTLAAWDDDNIVYDLVSTEDLYCEPQYRDSVEVVWDSIYGGIGTDLAYKIIQTNDEGYLLIGSVNDSTNVNNPSDEYNISDHSPQSDMDYWVVKLDSNYIKEWDYLYTGKSNDILIDVIQLADGSYILGGYSNSSWHSDFDKSTDAPLIGNNDFWVIKLNSNGSIDWQKTYGTNRDETLSRMLLLSNGSLLLGGTQTNGSDKDYIVYNISLATRNTLWVKSYSSGGSSVDILNDMYQDHNHRVLLAGTSDGSIGDNKTEASRGNFDYWILNIDPNDGSKYWDKTLGGEKDDVATSIIEDSQYNLVIAGHSNSSPNTGEHTATSYGETDIWVLKIFPNQLSPADLQILWDVSYGSTLKEGAGMFSSYEFVPDIIETKKGNYMIACTTEDDFANPTSTREHIRNISDYSGWLVYIDEEGEHIWDHMIGGKERYSYFAHILQAQDYSFSAILTSNSGDTGIGNEEKSSDPYGGGPAFRNDYWAINLGQECDSMTIAFRWTDTLSFSPQMDTLTVEQITCEEANITAIYNSIYGQKDQIIAAKLSELEEAYQEQCTMPQSIDDTYKSKYLLKYHHYTLYYYDRVGNLIKTVPPEGVEKAASLTSRSDIPNHRLVTEYEYNSLGQLIKQNTPDGGTTEFFYNHIGQLRFSVNAQQRADQTFAYTKYDALGRITEVGLADSINNYLDSINYNQLYPSLALSEQVYTVYSNAHPSIKSIDGQDQTYILNRVSYVYSRTADGDSVQTIYSYDPHGNVAWMAQDLPGLGTQYVNYTYDLLTGNVLEVAYNEGKTDQFYHRYAYDADNRIILAESSYDGEIWDKDAAYEYYLHGLLKRTALGEDKIQGLDYTYTLQGWLKSINNPAMNPINDPGLDGATGSNFAPDVYAQALSYYQNDFNRTGAFGTAGSDGLVEQGANANSELFNGNITSWTTNTYIDQGSNFLVHPNEAVAFQYKYDELQRIKESHFHTGAAFDPDGAYDIFVNYDANGNILKLNRRSDGLIGPMDSLSYAYPKNNDGDIIKNRLDSVIDYADANAIDDVEGILVYQYDSIGNLISNLAEGIDTIKWTAHGKIAEIIKDPTADNNSNLRFTYDASGNRVMKEVIDPSNPMATETTYYIRDAQGNILSTYKKTIESDRLVYHLQEQNIYGSSRLGLRQSNLEVKSVMHPGTADAFTNLSNTHVKKTEYKQPALPYVKREYVLSNTQSLTQQLTQFNLSQSLLSMVYTSGKIDYDMHQNQLLAVNGFETGKMENNIAVSENKEGYTGIIAMTYLPQVNNPFVSTVDYCKVTDAYGNLAMGSGAIKSGYQNSAIAIEATQGSNKHFLFTTKNTKAYYSVITKSSTLNVTTTNQQLSPDSSGFGKKMAVMADYTRNKALYLRRYENGRSYLHSYEIGSTSLTSKGYQDDFASSDVNGEGDMQISTDGRLLAVANRYGGSALVAAGTEIRFYIISEDRTELSFSDSIILEDVYMNHFDFSPENKYIYYSGRMANNAWNLKRIDLSTEQTEIVESNVSAYVRRGHDGRVYYGRRGHSELYYIEQPDLASVTLDQMTLENDALWRHMGSMPLQAHLQYDYQPEYFVRELGHKRYELTDHLGNVRAVISDQKEPDDFNNPTAFTPSVLTAQDYYPFGSILNGRSITGSGYRFGYNGQENDNEIFGSTGSWLNFKYRGYDSRIARFFAVDPLVSDYPYWTPYQFAGLMPIRFVELEGLEPGEPFDTKTEAALNFSSIYGKFSIQENREYSATIYSYKDKDGNTKYTYNNPKRGSKAGAPLNSVRKREGKKAAGIHSHGAYDKRYDNNNFSDTDKSLSESEDVPEFVTTPSGVLREYDPTSKNDTEVDRSSPSDPNDPNNVNTNHAIKKGLTKKETRQARKAKTKENKVIRKKYKEKYKEILKSRKNEKT